MYSSIIIFLVEGIIIFLFIVLLSRKKRALNLSRILQKAEQELERKQLEKAQKHYDMIINGFGTKTRKKLKKEILSKEKEILGKAYRGLGNIYESKNEKEKAFNYYKHARKNNVSLSVNAIVFLGNSYADLSDQSDDAVSIYLDLIKLKPLDKQTEKVYSTLEKTCLIDEKTEAKKRQKLFSINQKVIGINKKIEWAHFYAGVACFLSNSYSNSINYLNSAQQLNPDRQLTYYYLGKAYLNQDNKQVESILNTVNKFLSFTSEIAEIKVKQGESAFQIGKLLLNQIEGFDNANLIIQSKDKEKVLQAKKYLAEAVSKDASKSEYYFYLGRTCSLNEDANEAINAFEKAVSIEPSYDMYLFYLAKEYSLLNKNKSIKILQDVLKLNKNYIEAHALLADNYIQTKEYNLAEKHCRILQKLNNKFDVRILFNLIHALYYQDKHKEIIEEIEKSPAFISKNDPDVAFFIARSYSLQNHFAKAAAWYKDLPEDPKMLYYYSCALANNKEYEAAIQKLKKVVETDNEYKCKAFLQTGIILLTTGNMDEAIENLNCAYKINPEDHDILYALGCYYYTLNNLERSLEHFEKLLQKNSNYKNVQFYVGLIKEKNGEFTEALKNYDYAVNDESTSVSGHLRSAILYYKLSDYSKALEHFEKIESIKDSNDPYAFYYGLVLSLTGSFEKALEIWDGLFRRHPEDERLALNISRAHYLLGKKYFESKIYDGAIKEWEEYIKRYKDDEKTQKDLALIYFISGLDELSKESKEISTAYKSFQRAVELDERNNLYVYYLGICELGLNNQSECISQLKRILDCEPENVRIKYHLGLALLKDNQSETALQIFNELRSNNFDPVYSESAAIIIANEYIKEKKYEDAKSILEVLI